MSTGRVPSQPASSPFLSLFEYGRPLPNTWSTLISSVLSWDQLAAEADGTHHLLEPLARVEVGEQASPLVAPGLG